MFPGAMVILFFALEMLSNVSVHEHEHSPQQLGTLEHAILEVKLRFLDLSIR